MTKRRSAVLVGPMVAVLSLLLATPALADRPFNARFSANANGDIAVVGNTLETCQTSATDCGRARDGQGTRVSNNDFVMERVDIDNDANTFDSSAAHLALPGGARVLFAGLYYGARTNAGTRGKAAIDSSRSALRRVDIKAPGQSNYERLSGGEAVLDESSDITGAYQVFHNVTEPRPASRRGVYTVADVQSATGEDRYAGWSLIVAYEAPADPPRNLTVFDGLQSVTPGQARR